MELKMADRDDFKYTHVAEKIVIDDYRVKLSHDPEYFSDHHKAFSKRMQQINTIASEEGGRQKLNEVAGKIESQNGVLYQYLNDHAKVARENVAQNGPGRADYTHHYKSMIDVTKVPTSHENWVDKPSPAESAAKNALHILEVAENGGVLVQRANQMAGVQSEERHRNESQAGTFRPRNITGSETNSPNPMSLHSREAQKKTEVPHDEDIKNNAPLNGSDASDFIQQRVLENLRNHVAKTENAQAIDNGMTV
jgi:hypothetical protein